MASLTMCVKTILRSNLLPKTSSPWMLNSPTSILGCTQVRFSRRITKPRSIWPKRKSGYLTQDLTPGNKEFLDHYVQDQFPGGKAPVVESPLSEPPWPRGKWAPRSQRTGVIARKIGIYPMWLKDGRRILTTVLQVLDNHVINYIPPEHFVLTTEGAKYKGRLGKIVVGADTADPRLFTASYNGLFTKAGVQTKRKLTKFLVSPNAALQPGTPLSAMHFRVGDYVDVYGKTVGHGFQGVMKRWGFKGGPATHGCTKSHRRPGNIGGPRDIARVWPGKKLPGHMGQERRYLRGVKIMRINTKYNIIYVRGPAVPGSVHSYVNILDTILIYRFGDESTRPFPTFFADDRKEQLPEEYYDETVHVFSDPTITFPEEVKTSKSKKAAATSSAKR